MTFKETIELFMNHRSDSSYEIYGFYKFLFSEKGINDNLINSY